MEIADILKLLSKVDAEKALGCLDSLKSAFAQTRDLLPESYKEQRDKISQAMLAVEAWRDFIRKALPLIALFHL